MKQAVQHLFWFIGLLMFQLLLLDNLHVMGMFIPLLYVYAILRLPSTLSTYLVLIISFLTGMTMDIFSNTPGLHAAATTLMGMLRYPLIRLFVLKEDLSNRNISMDSLGRTVFWRYVTPLVLIHHTSLYLLESLSYLNVANLLMKIPVCSLLTLLFIMALELVSPKDHAR
jgi:hypothetical protein